MTSCVYHSLKFVGNSALKKTFQIYPQNTLSSVTSCNSTSKNILKKFCLKSYLISIFPLKNKKEWITSVDCLPEETLPISLSKVKALGYGGLRKNITSCFFNLLRIWKKGQHASSDDVYEQGRVLHSCGWPFQPFRVVLVLVWLWRAYFPSTRLILWHTKSLQAIISDAVGMLGRKN